MHLQGRSRTTTAVHLENNKSFSLSQRRSYLQNLIENNFVELF
jgi:hypothetical protein